jgi:dephospho-CoA kinase
VRERGLRETEAMDMIVAQMPAELKRARADHVIDNDGTLTQLDERVAQAWSALQAEAGTAADFQCRAEEGRQACREETGRKPVKSDLFFARARGTNSRHSFNNRSAPS